VPGAPSGEVQSGAHLLAGPAVQGIFLSRQARGEERLSLPPQPRATTRAGQTVGEVAAPTPSGGRGWSEEVSPPPAPRAATEAVQKTIGPARAERAGPTPGRDDPKRPLGGAGAAPAPQAPLRASRLLSRDSEAVRDAAESGGAAPGRTVADATTAPTPLRYLADRGAKQTPSSGRLAQQRSRTPDGKPARPSKARETQWESPQQLELRPGRPHQGAQEPERAESADDGQQARSTASQSKQGRPRPAARKVRKDGRRPARGPAAGERGAKDAGVELDDDAAAYTAAGPAMSWRAPAAARPAKAQPPSTPPPRETAPQGIEEMAEQELLAVLRSLTVRSPEARQLLREVQEQIDEYWRIERLRRIS